jgi:hypothetical protein
MLPWFKVILPFVLVDTRSMISRPNAGPEIRAWRMAACAVTGSFMSDSVSSRLEECNLKL